MAAQSRSRDINITLRVDADDLLWARVRAGFARTSVNALLRRFLAEYAAVPERFRNGEAPPWTGAATAGEAFVEVLNPVGAGDRAREGLGDG